MNKIYVLYCDLQDDPIAYSSNIDKSIKLAELYINTVHAHRTSFDLHLYSVDVDSLNDKNIHRIYSIAHTSSQTVLFLDDSDRDKSIYDKIPTNWKF
jgi:hypothetical protein